MAKFFFWTNVLAMIGLNTYQIFIGKPLSPPNAMMTGIAFVFLWWMVQDEIKKQKGGS